VLGKRRESLKIFLSEQSRFHQNFRADEQRIAGKGGNTAVGRIASDPFRRIQRQDLPITLFPLGKEIGEASRSRSQVPDTERRSKRSQMEENAASSFIHGFIPSSLSIRLSNRCGFHQSLFPGTGAKLLRHGFVTAQTRNSGPEKIILLP